MQYKVEVEKPNPVFARMLQQAIGGIEGEMRVAMQYLFQSWNSRGPKKYREMLLETGTEELAHVEMLATAVALNLEGADGALKAQMAKENSAVGAIQSGMDPRHYLSGGLGALAADMISNVNAESTGRAFDAPVRVHRRSRHEGYVVVHDRARHHAPAAVAGGRRRVGRLRGRVADP